MPTYEFRCPEGHEFEKFYRSIGGAESTALCPECGERAERMMSAAGFAFKGSGFYLTDYGKNAHRGEAPDTKSKASSSEGSSGSEKSDGGKNDSTGSDSGKSDGTKNDSGTSSGDSAKKESAKGTDSAKPATDAKKTEAKSTEAKPASTPKPSAGE